jgi:hypothetical protein
MDEAKDHGSREAREQPKSRPKRRRAGRKDPFANASPQQILNLRAAMILSFIHGVNADAFAHHGDVAKSQRERELSHRNFDRAKVTMDSIKKKPRRRKQTRDIEAGVASMQPNNQTD